MMKIIDIIISFIIISFWSCDKNIETVQEIISIDEAKIVENKLGLIPPNPVEFSFRIYILDDSCFLHETDFNFLKSLYDLHYKESFNSLSSFFYEVVNQKIKLKSIYFKKNKLSCRLDNTIMEVYYNRKIGGIFDKYCFYDKEKCRYILDHGNIYKPCEINTISYYFFINKYLISIDDYNNELSFSKKKRLMYLYK